MVYRNYNDCDYSVLQCYEQRRIHHSVEFVQHLIRKYATTPYERAFSVPDILALLDTLVDVSDPDLALPNSKHAMQAAEAATKAGEPDWMVVTALIHDFGKMLCFLAPSDDDGTSPTTQWSVVGDTFVCGHALPSSLPFPTLKVKAHDSHVEYPPNCGLRNTTIAFGHDEFMYRALRRMVDLGQCTLPTEALDAIRFHSLYAWHTHGAYGELEDSVDVATKPVVLKLNQYDLYSKSNKVYEYGPQLERLIAKFFPNGGLLSF